MYKKNSLHTVGQQIAEIVRCKKMLEIVRQLCRSL